MAQWYFPSIKNLGYKGFNSIGDQFKDNSVFHLSKEICQNSLDTMLSEFYENNGEPIRIEFSEYWMNSRSIPGNENGDLEKVFVDEYNFSNNFFENDKTVVEFYDKAVSTIRSQNIRCLRISDFNTPGLIGSNKGNDVSTPWNNLTKNAGVSDKGSASGGSKGEGKFVSFICSDLYTVYYSTYAKDGLKASCGISRLSSYKKDNDEVTTGEGYYDNNNTPIQGCLDLDPSYTRREYGTDLYIIGFKNFSNWKETMIAAIIDSFFTAIIKGNLEVIICKDYVLNKNTIFELAAKDGIKPLLGENTLAYLSIVQQDGLGIYTYSMFEKDDLKLVLMKDIEEYNSGNRVAAVRFTGMKILDLAYLPRRGKYHGILFMDGIKLNAYFRKLENATHSKWSVDRDVKNPEIAKQKIDELKKFVRDSIEKEFASDNIDEMDATGIEELLPDEDEFGNDDGGENREGISNDTVKTIKINEKIKKQSPSKTKIIDDTDEESDEIVLDENGQVIDNKPVPGNHPSGVGPNPNPMEDEKHKYSYVNRRTVPSKLRLISNSDIYKLLLKVSEDEPILKLSFEIYGENSNEKYIPETIFIRDEEGNKKPIEVDNGEYIIKDAIANKEYTILITNNTDGEWPMEVKVYGINK